MLSPSEDSEIIAATLALWRYALEKADTKVIPLITKCLLPSPRRDVLAFLGKDPEPKPTIVRKSDADFVDVVSAWALSPRTHTPGPRKATTWLRACPSTFRPRRRSDPRR